MPATNGRRLGGHIQPSAILKKARQASGEGARQGHRQLEWLGQSRRRQRKRRLELCQRVRRQGQERKRRKQGQEQEQRLGEPGERRGGLGEDPGQARSRQISPDAAGLLAKAVQPDRPGLIPILHESEQLERKDSWKESHSWKHIPIRKPLSQRESRTWDHRLHHG